MLRWARHPPVLEDIESEFRLRLARNGKSRTAVACREIGWLFSGWEPDTSL
jgi:hypothetical protein